MADKTINVLTHLLGIFTGFIGALIIFVATSDKTAKEHAKAALNWQISTIIYYIISTVLIIVIIGIFLIWLIPILNTIFCIIAAVKASENNVWDYPLTIKFLK